MRSKTLPFAALLLSCLLAAGGCTPIVANRGNIIDPAKLAEIKVNVSTREDVASKLGTPTEVSTFDENTWYYFGRHTEQYSFFDPEVLEKKAVEIKFNDTGTVVAVNNLDPNDARDVDPVDRRTPTYGHETTFLEQLVGNAGHVGGIGSKQNGNTH